MNTEKREKKKKTSNMCDSKCVNAMRTCQMATLTTTARTSNEMMAFISVETKNEKNAFNTLDKLRFLKFIEILFHELNTTYNMYAI